MLTRQVQCWLTTFAGVLIERVCCQAAKHAYSSCACMQQLSYGEQTLQELNCCRSCKLSSMQCSIAVTKSSAKCLAKVFIETNHAMFQHEHSMHIMQSFSMKTLNEYCNGSEYLRHMGDYLPRRHCCVAHLLCGRCCHGITGRCYTVPGSWLSGCQHMLCDLCQESALDACSKMPI